MISLWHEKRHASARPSRRGTEDGVRFIDASAEKSNE